MTLNALGEDFTRQMLILQHLPATAASVVAGDHDDVEWCKQCQQLLAGFIGSGTKSVGQYIACFGVIRVSQPVLPGFTANEAPLLIKFADKRHFSMGNRPRRYLTLPQNPAPFRNRIPA